LPGRQFLDAEPPVSLHDMTVSELRETLRGHIDRNFERFALPGPSVADVHDHRVAVEGGVITVRLYRPRRNEVLPAHLLLHGGGWRGGSIDELVSDAAARHRAVAAGCVVAAVEYRLAPEFPFPTAVGDSVAALRWLSANATDLGIDPSNLSIGGVSAGANLAAAALLSASEQVVRAAVLEVPVLDLTGRHLRRPSHLRTVGPDWDKSAAELPVLYACYLPDLGQAESPLASPLLAPDLTGFPPTFVVTAELDPLCTEGELFAKRLQDAGVPTQQRRYSGALHGSLILNGVWPTARRWHDDVLAYLANAHAD
jgi:acetyl esterase